MDRKASTNLSVEQTLGCIDFAKHMNNSISYEKLEGVLSNEKLAGIKKVIITGCGDSWLAGIAAKPTFDKFCGAEIVPMRCIEFTRYLDAKELGEDVLVLVISISGGVSRVVEAAKKAANHGACTIAITNNVESPVAVECTDSIFLDMLPLERTPGISSYIASTMTLMNVALKMGLAKGLISKDDFDAKKAAILAYIESYAPYMDTIDEQMFQLSLKDSWKDATAYDFIGDYADWATAFFGGAKFVEAFGAIMTCDDSEDWLHINAFVRNPEKIATTIIANEDSPSFTRVCETLKSIASLGRPAIIVTDAPADKIEAGIEVVSVPKDSEGWIAPIMQHVPVDFLCGYIAVLKNTMYYRQDEAAWQTDTLQNRIKGSNVETL